MSNIVLYDPDNVTVPRCVTQYLKSVNTPDYDGVTDKVVNPDLSAVSAVAQKYWKESTGSIVEMSQAEKDAIDALTPSESMWTAWRRTQQQHRAT